MKKIFIVLLIPLIAISLVGCSSNAAKVTTNFDKELESIESIVSSTNTSEISQVCASLAYSGNSDNTIQNYKSIAYNNMKREEELRQQVLTLNSYLKNNAIENINLSKSEQTALNSLTNNIKKYTAQLKESKSRLKKNVNNIKKNIKSNTEITQSSYVSLNNCMNERYVCLCNIYNNLEQANIFLFEKDYSAQEKLNKQPSEFNQDKNKQNNTENEPNKETEKKTEKGFKKNIDSFARPNKNETKTKKENNYPTNVPYNQNYYNNYSPYYNNYPIPPYNNGYNMYNNGYMYNRFNGFGNGYGYNPQMYNPGRNTDTFYPFNRNIDTYRINPSMYNGNNMYLPPINEIPTNAQIETEDKIQDKNTQSNELEEEKECNNKDSCCEKTA